MGLSQLGSVQPQIILVDLLWPATRLWASCSVERATLGVGLEASGTCENNCARLAANIYTGKCGAPDTGTLYCKTGLYSPERKKDTGEPVYPGSNGKKTPGSVL
jgi:hypothetical protein